jgi:hypothetical protein
MLLEHIFYNLFIAILISIIYDKYIGKTLVGHNFFGYAFRNPAWLIVVFSFILDIDLLLQNIHYYITLYFGNIPIHILFNIYHGDFHNLLLILILAIVFGYMYSDFYKESFMGGFICIFIAGLAHLIEDYCVYDNIYYLLVPFSNQSFHTWNLIHETRNFYGIGDFNIFVIGIILVILGVILKIIINSIMVDK